MGSRAVGIGAAVAIAVAACFAIWATRRDPSRSGGDGGSRTTSAVGSGSGIPASETPGAVEGEVQLPDGTRVDGAEIEPFTYDTEPRRGTAVRSDAAGGFRIEGLPPGMYALRARLEGKGSATMTGVNVAPHGTAKLPRPLVLRPGAEWILHVLGSSEKPLEGADAQLQLKVAHSGGLDYPVLLARATTDASGAASFDGLEDGEYHVELRRDGYAIRHEHFRIDGGRIPGHVLRIRMTARE